MAPSQRLATADGGPWWLYVIRRADGALYAGISIDVARRLAQHRDGAGAKALRGRGPLQLLCRVRVGPLGTALRHERAFKRLSKRQKEHLVHGRSRLRRWLAAR